MSITLRRRSPEISDGGSPGDDGVGVPFACDDVPSVFIVSAVINAAIAFAAAAAADGCCGLHGPQPDHNLLETRHTPPRIS